MLNQSDKQFFANPKPTECFGYGILYQAGINRILGTGDPNNKESRCNME